MTTPRQTTAQGANSHPLRARRQLENYIARGDEYPAAYSLRAAPHSAGVTRINATHAHPRVRNCTRTPEKREIATREYIALSFARTP